MSALDLDLLANTGFFVILLSYAMRDILLLRILSVLAICIIVPYYFLLPESVWPAIGWNLAFAAINVYWIVRLSAERWPVSFTDDEQRLYEGTLRALRPREARKLFHAGSWKSVAAGEQVTTQGQPLNELSLVAGGDFTVEKNGRVVDEIGEGRFIGSFNFLEGSSDQPAPVTFRATLPSRLIVWRNEDLRRLISADHELSMAVEARLGLELAWFLDHARESLARAKLPIEKGQHRSMAR